MTKEKERFEILLEEIKGHIKGVAEGHAVIRNEMQRGFNEVKEQIKFVDGKVVFLGSEVREVRAELKEVKAELKEVKVKADKIDNTLEEHVRQPAHAVS